MPLQQADPSEPFYPKQDVHHALAASVLQSNRWQVLSPSQNRPRRSRTTPRTIKRTPKSQSPNAQQYRGKATCNVQARRRRPITKPSLPQPAFAPNYFPIDPTHTPAIYGPLATSGHSQHECTAGARCFCVFDLAPTGQVSDSRASKCRINCR